MTAWANEEAMEKDPQDFTQLFNLQRDKIVARRTSFGYTERRAALDQLREMVKSNEDAICAALAADFGKHRQETILTEILPLLVEIKHTRRHLRRWMRPKRTDGGMTFLGTSARVHPTPK